MGPAPCPAVRIVRSPVGALAIGAGAAGIRFVRFDGARGDGAAGVDRPGVGQGAAAAHLDRLEDELARYFAGALREFTVALDLRGTEFRRAVWERLRAIPFGRTLSYEALARGLGLANGQRAVGGANGANPAAIVVPCHRVIAKDGSLGGYGGGLERKRWLLDNERQRVSDAVEAQRTVWGTTLKSVSRTSTLNMCGA